MVGWATRLREHLYLIGSLLYLAGSIFYTIAGLATIPQAADMGNLGNVCFVLGSMLFVVDGANCKREGAKKSEEAHTTEV
mmetsp:Transcript_13281/g.24995  ORF Transcript_13281/g.24995 Transcript_13281/m.24995 type:complete len:80 (-) Transcript_13281:435-674(-)